jgi:hypothetical protein
MAERLSNAASRKLPQIISPPMKTPRSTIVFPLNGGRGQRLDDLHSSVRRLLVGTPAVMCPFGQLRPLRGSISGSHSPHRHCGTWSCRRQASRAPFVRP